MKQKFYETRLLMRHDLTVNWERAVNFVGLAGEIIIYDDHDSIGEGENKVNVPGLKVCDGQTKLKDLPFIDDVTNAILRAHISNDVIHMTAEEHQMLKDHEYHLTWHTLGEVAENEEAEAEG